jgi:hypothetical protein
MAKNNYSKFTASYLDCLSMLESNTAVLYTALADKVNLPQVKSVLLGAANDSQKALCAAEGRGRESGKNQNEISRRRKARGRLQRDLYHLQGDN